MSNEITKFPDVLKTPEAQASVNAVIAATVKESVQAIFASLGPVLKDMAVTPEKLREGLKPWQDPAKIARELRESLKSRADEEEIRKQDAARKANCPHLDQNGRSSLRLVHNQLDHQPRGLCVLCGDWVHPREWRIGPPTEKEPKGHAYLVPAHKDYKTVQILESQT